MSATATSSAWNELTPVQSDAVHATAAAHDLNPEQLAAELLPLLRPAEGRTTSPDPASAACCALERRHQPPNQDCSRQTQR